MSQEASTWLNTRTLIGFTGQRGHAWHYRAGDQGEEPNHYPGAVPVEAVQLRLFGWDAVTASVFAEYYNPDGFVRLTDPARKAVVRPAGAFGPDDAGAILGLFKDGYQAWTQAESPETGAAYSQLVLQLRKVAGAAMHTAWQEPALNEDAGMNIGADRVDLTELGTAEQQFLQAAKAHVAALTRPWWRRLFRRPF